MNSQKASSLHAMISETLNQSARFLNQPEVTQMLAHVMRFEREEFGALAAKIQPTQEIAESLVHAYVNSLCALNTQLNQDNKNKNKKGLQKDVMAYLVSSGQDFWSSLSPLDFSLISFADKKETDYRLLTNFIDFLQDKSGNAPNVQECIASLWFRFVSNPPQKQTAADQKFLDRLRKDTTALLVLQALVRGIKDRTRWGGHAGFVTKDEAVFFEGLIEAPATTQEQRDQYIEILSPLEGLSEKSPLLKALLERYHLQKATQKPSSQKSATAPRKM